MRVCIVRANQKKVTVSPEPSPEPIAERTTDRIDRVRATVRGHLGEQPLCQPTAGGFPRTTNDEEPSSSNSRAYPTLPVSYTPD